MTGDIGERLLANPEKADRNTGRIAEVRKRGSKFGTDPRPPLELLTLPFDRCYKTQIIQDARPQRRGNSPDSHYGRVQQTEDSARLLPERFIFLHGFPFAQP